MITSGASVVLAGSGAPLAGSLAAALKFKTLEVLAVYAQPVADRAVARICQDRNIAFDDIGGLRKGATQPIEIRDHDVFLSVNSTVLFPPEVLGRARTGALNMHPGRLPDYAGLHVNQWAIRNGEQTFAATLHWMEDEIDAGPIALMESFQVDARETGLTLLLKCLRSGTALVIQALEMIAKGQPLPRIPQDLSRRRVFRHADALDGNIDWQQSADLIERLVRALNYGGLASPTAIASFSVDGRSYRVESAEVALVDTQHCPGQIVSVASDRLVVAAGCGSWVAITRVRDERGTLLQPDRLPFARVGTVLE